MQRYTSAQIGETKKRRRALTAALSGVRTSVCKVNLSAWDEVRSHTLTHDDAQVVMASVV